MWELRKGLPMRMSQVPFIRQDGRRARTSFFFLQEKKAREKGKRKCGTIFVSVLLILLILQYRRLPF